MSISKQDLFDMIPTFYQQSDIMDKILGAEATELSALYSAIEDIRNQLFVDTATWGLDRWEKIVGLGTDTSKTYDDRRALIKTRLQGYGTVTDAFLKDVARTVFNGDITIQTFPSAYQVDITFNNIKGRPPIVLELQAQLSQLIPAHLLINYIYTYNTWADIDTNAWTWGTTPDVTWSAFETI